MPTEPVPYQQLLRGPQRRWWKPLLCLLLAGLFAIGLIMLATVPVVIAGMVVGAPDLVAYTIDETTNLSDLGPVGFGYTNLALIVMIPAATLSIWIVHGVRPRYLASVAGGIRWRWLARCVLLLAPLWIAYAGLGLLVQAPTSPRPDQWLVLLVMVIVMTPLQSAAEEYLFRGWVMQNIGAWFARPLVGLVVGLAVSAAVFAAAHGSPDPWIIGTLAALAVVSGIAAWRTGGLEAGIAMHAVNNVVTFLVVISVGGWQEVFVRADTEGGPSTLVLALLVDGGALALILWQARRQGIQRNFRPQPVPQPDPVPFTQPLPYPTSIDPLAPGAESYPPPPPGGPPAPHQ